MKSAKDFLASPSGRLLRDMVRVQRVLKGRWRTFAELYAELRMSQGSARLRHIVNALADEGVLRARHRPHEWREDGERDTGPLPREFRLSSKWADL